MPAVDDRTAFPTGKAHLFHEVAGEGEPLVLLNGVMMTTQSWVFQTRRLSERYRCVLHDFRGQLRSPRPPGTIEMREHVDDLAALLDHLRIDRAHVVGTSYGGEVGMMFALRHPERVRTLTVIASVSHVEPPLAQAVRLWRDTALTAPQLLFDVTAPFNFSPFVISPAFLEQGRARLAGYPPEFFSGFASLCEAFLSLDIRHRLPEISVPTLVVCGASDSLKPVSYSELLAAAIPRARLTIIEDGPHAVVIEKHDAVNEAVLAFLASAR